MKNVTSKGTREIVCNLWLPDWIIRLTKRFIFIASAGESSFLIFFNNRYSCLAFSLISVKFPDYFHHLNRLVTASYDIILG